MRRVRHGWRLAAAAATPLVTAALVAVVMVVNTAARDHLWRFEWRWATFQYHFGVLLVAPVLAGAAALVGARGASARWLSRPAGSAAGALAPLAVTIAAGAGAYVAAFAVPAAIVVRSGTADRLTLGTVATFGPALAVLVAAVGLGGAIGARWPVRLVPPLTAAATFGLLLGGWVAGLERLVRVGGAGTPMTELAPQGAIQVAQIAAYLGAAGAAFGWVGMRLGGRPSALRLATWSSLVVGLAAAGWLATTDHPLLHHPRAELACVSDPAGQRYCAAPPYRSELPPLAAHYGPLVARVRAVGADVPRRIRLDGSIPTMFERPPDPPTDGSVIFPLLGLGDCLARLPPDADVGGLTLWVALVVGDESQTATARIDPAVPAQLRSSDADDQDAWATAALARLTARCAAAK